MLLILFGRLREVKLGPQTRAVTFVYVVAGETVYKREERVDSRFHASLERNKMQGNDLNAKPEKHSS